MSQQLMTRRKALRRLLTIGAGAAFLTACGSTPTPQVVEKVVEKEVTKIIQGTPQVVKETVVIKETSVVEQVVTATAAPKGPVKLIFADYVYDQADQQKQVDMWNEKHPEIQVEGQFMPGDTYWTKIQTQVAGGQVPDCIDNSIAYVVVLAFRNGLVELEPLIERDNFPIKDFYTGTVDAFRWEYGQIKTGKGKLWGLPSSAQTAHMFFYNKTMFDKEGIPYPDDKWDWTKLTEVAKAMTKTSGGATEQWGINMYASTYMMWWPSTWQSGGEWFDAEMHTCLADSDPSLQAVNHIVDFFQKDKSAPLPGSLQSDPFLTGKVAMAYDGYWQATMGFANIKEFDWDVAVPPAAPGKPHIIDLEEDAWSIMNGSKHVNEAWEFLKWLTTGEGGEFACQNINAGFPYKPIVNKLTYTKDKKTNPKSLWLYSDLLDKGHSSYVAGSWAEFEGAGSSELEAGVIGEKKPAALVKDTTEKVNSILADAWKKYVG